MDDFLGRLLDDIPWDVAALDPAVGRSDDGPKGSSTAPPDIDDLDLDALSDVDWQAFDAAEDLLQNAASPSPHSSSHPTPAGPGAESLPWQQHAPAPVGANTDADAAYPHRQETLAVQPCRRAPSHPARGPLPGQLAPADPPPAQLTRDHHDPATANPASSSACALLHPSPLPSLVSASPPAAAASAPPPPPVACTPEAPVPPASATSAAAAATPAAPSSALLGGGGFGAYSSGFGNAGSHSMVADNLSPASVPAAAATAATPFVQLSQSSVSGGSSSVDRGTSGRDPVAPWPTRRPSQPIPAAQPHQRAVHAAAAPAAAAATDPTAEAQRQQEERRRLSRAAAAVAAAATLGLPPPDLVALGLLPPGHRYHTCGPAAAVERPWDSSAAARLAGGLVPPAQAHSGALGANATAAANGASPAQPCMLRRYTSSSMLQGAAHHPYLRPRDRSGPSAATATRSFSSAAPLSAHGSCPLLLAASPASSTARPRSPHGSRPERTRSSLYGGGGAGSQRYDAGAGGVHHASGGAISEVLSYNAVTMPYEDALFDELLSVGSDELGLCGMDVDLPPDGAAAAAAAAVGNDASMCTGWLGGAVPPPLAPGAYIAPRHSSNGGASREGGGGGGFLAGSPPPPAGGHLEVQVGDNEADLQALRELLCSRSSGGGGGGFDGGCYGDSLGQVPAEQTGFGRPPCYQGEAGAGSAGAVGGGGGMVQQTWSMPERVTAAAAPYGAGGGDAAGGAHAFQSLNLPGMQPHAAPVSVASSVGGSPSTARHPAHGPPPLSECGYHHGNTGTYSSAPAWAPPAQQQQQRLPSAAPGNTRSPCTCADCCRAAAAPVGISGGGGSLPHAATSSAPAPPPQPPPPPPALQQPARCMLPCCNPVAPPARATCQLPCCAGLRATGAAVQQCRPAPWPHAAPASAPAPGYPTSHQVPPCAQASSQPYYPHSRPAPAPSSYAPQFDSTTGPHGGNPAAQPYRAQVSYSYTHLAAVPAGSGPSTAAPAAPLPGARSGPSFSAAAAPGVQGAASQFPALYNQSQQQPQGHPGAYGSRQLRAGAATASGCGPAAGQFPSRNATALPRYGALPLPGAAQSMAPAPARPHYAPMQQQQHRPGHGASSPLPLPQAARLQMWQQRQHQQQNFNQMPSAQSNPAQHQPQQHAPASCVMQQGWPQQQQ